MESLVRRIAGLLVTGFILLTGQLAWAENEWDSYFAGKCEVMALTLPAELLAGTKPGERLERIPLNNNPGNVGWLSWDGEQSLAALIESLSPPGTASRYRDPLQLSQTFLKPGAWIGGMNGVRNAAAVRQAMDALIGQTIRVPLHDDTRGQGRMDYRLSHFAWIVLQEYSLAGNAWISFTYEGVAPCRVNAPPLITSHPLKSATTGEWYRYDLEADDPDFDVGDVITYSLVNGPDAMQVNPYSGEVNWQVDTNWLGTHRLVNDSCLASGGDGAAPSADVIMVVDESGSMSGEHAWLKELALPLEAHLQSNGIGEGDAQNLYGLLGFERVPRPISVDGEAMGPWDAFRDATQALELYGGIEDGWRAIRYALRDYPLRPEAAQNIILITDEGRDITDSSITYASLLAEMQEAGAILNAVVNARFICTDSNQKQVAALGMDADGTGYLADGMGGYLTCDKAQATWGHKNTTNTLDVYVALALDTGGAAWDLNYLRAGGLLAQSFTAALIDIKVREIREQLPPIPMADLYIGSLMETAQGIEVVAGNRGLVDVTNPIQVSLLDATGRNAYTQSLDGLAQGQHQTLLFDYPDWESGSLTVVIGTDNGDEECLDDNNRLTVPWITLRAEDRGGLYDEQRFTLDILTSNRPPRILSEPVSLASAGALYRYAVEAQDPDLGDSLSYSLDIAPPGMDIDAVTGVIRFLANPGQLGEHAVQVRVRDIIGASAVQDFILTVEQAYILPRFVSQPLLRAVQGLDYRYRLEVQSDGEAHVEYAIVHGPAGMAVDESGLIAWTVPADFAGKKAEVVARVRDQFGNYDLQFFTLTGSASNSPPQILSEADSWVELGETYYYSIEASDPDADPLRYELLSGPDNMFLDAQSGQLHWQPLYSYVAPVSVAVQVQDPYGASAEQYFTITVYDGPNYPPVFQSEPEIQAWVGQSYHYQTMIVDPDGDPLQVTLLVAPAGVQWDDKTHALTWLPQADQIGEHLFEIEAVDPRGGTATQRFKVLVAMPNRPPVFESIPPATVEEGTLYLYTAKAVDPDDDTLSYALIVAPSGALLDSVSGELSWYAQNPGEHAFELHALDGRGGLAIQIFDVQVLEPELPPSLCHALLVDN